MTSDKVKIFTAVSSKSFLNSYAVGTHRQTTLLFTSANQTKCNYRYTIYIMSHKQEMAGAEMHAVDLLLESVDKYRK